VVFAEGVGVAEELGPDLLHRGHLGNGHTLLDPDDQGLDIQGVFEVVGQDQRVLEWVGRVELGPYSQHYILFITYELPISDIR